jgi:hypothetical protein
MPMNGYPEGNASGGNRWFCVQYIDSHRSLYELWFARVMRYLEVGVGPPQFYHRTCAIGSGELCRQVLEVFGAFASSHCVVALESGVKIVMPKGLVALALECFCRLSISTCGHSPRVLCYGVETKVVIWVPNQLIID